MVDTSQLTELISALRAETEADSVSPERVGYVLQKIVDILPSLDSSELVANVTAALETARQALDTAQSANTTSQTAQTAVATLDTLMNTLQTTMPNKADKTEVQALQTAMDTEMAGKADKTEVQALQTAMNTAMAGKADKTTVQNIDARLSTFEEAELPDRVDTTEHCIEDIAEAMLLVSVTDNAGKLSADKTAIQVGKVMAKQQFNLDIAPNVVYKLRRTNTTEDLFLRVMESRVWAAQNQTKVEIVAAGFVDSDKLTLHHVAIVDHAAHDETTHSITLTAEEYATRDDFDREIAVAKRQVFVDLWNEAVGEYGSYDAATGMFSLNGLTDITYAQAVTIYNQTSQFMGAMQSGKYSYCSFRTNIPNKSVYNSQSGASFTYAFRNNTAVEVIAGNYGTSGIIPTSLIDAFYGCTSLRVIDMVLNCNSITTQTNFSSSVFGRCAALEEVRLRNVRVNVDLSACPNISLDSLEYLVYNRPSGMAYENSITVYVHADVWSKLNHGDVGPEPWNALRVEAMQGPYWVNFALKTA